MSNNAGYVVKGSGTTSPASDDHANRAMSGDQVHDDEAQTVMQTLYDKTYALVGGSGGQSAPQIDGTRDHIETLPGGDVHNNAFPAILSTLQGKAYALVGASNGQTAPQVHQNLDHEETLPGIHIHDNNPPTMMATLQDQAYALVEGPAKILREDLNADSHDLAYEVQEVRGAIQTEHSNGSNAEVVRNIGWHKANVEVPDPLIGGYANGELFAFIRRFNKVRLSQSHYAI